MIPCERNCSDCIHFRIIVQPIRQIDMGVVECTKHGLIKEYMTRKAFMYLELCEDFKEKEV